MPVTAAQKATIDAIVSINETGRLPTAAAYSTVAVLADGAGISYGKHQSTDHSGSLDAVVMRYLDLGGTLAGNMMPFLDRLEANFSTRVNPKNPPQDVRDFMALLAQAGQERAMQRAQDEVFDERYWTPAVQACTAMGLQTALGHLAVYDTTIHSGSGRVGILRRRFPECPPATGGDERAWTVAFTKARRYWLANHPNPVVKRTVYRCDSILELATADNWDLVTPLTYRKVVVP